MAFGTDVSRVVVVGGGIAGLAAALRLERLYPGTEVVLVESRPRLGGTILTEEVSGFLIEGGPDSFLARKPRGIGLCKELGLTCDLIERDRAQLPHLRAARQRAAPAARRPDRDDPDPTRRAGVERHPLARRARPVRPRVRAAGRARRPATSRSPPS